jgi:hypothetical protein
MTDYWLSKLFFDLQNHALAAEYRADRKKVLERYRLKPEVCAALLGDDVGFLAKRVNPYLLRYYFTACGMPDATFIGKLRETASLPPRASHG